MSNPAIIGFRLDGRPIFGFSGAALEGDGGEGGGTEGDGSGGDSGGNPDAIGADGLNEAGRQAIARERAALKNVRTELRGFKAVLAEQGISSLDALKERLSTSGGSTQQPQVDVEQVRREAIREAEAKASKRVALAEVKVLAAGTFADPDDAVSALRDEVEDLVKDDGSPDTDAIKRALAATLTKKPHWAKPQENRPPDFDGGSRSNSGGSAQSFADFMRGQVAAKRGH